MQEQEHLVALRKQRQQNLLHGCHNAEPAFYKNSQIFDYLLLSYFTIHFDKKVKIMKRSCEKYCTLHL